MENKHSEIDILDLIATVFKDWKKLALYVGVGGIIGIIVALGTPKKYTATVILAPELQSGGLNIPSSLANMASTLGLDVSKNKQIDAIYPQIYPDIFASTDFAHDLLEMPVRLENDNEPRTYRDYLANDTKHSLIEYPIIWLGKLRESSEAEKQGGANEPIDPFRMSRKEWELADRIKKKILCVIDKNTSEINISFTEQDPMVAAIMVDTLQRRLQNYITEYRTQKAHLDYDFYSNAAKDAYAKFEVAQNQYTIYSGSHKNTRDITEISHIQTLKNKMDEAYGMYSNINKVCTQAKIKIQEQTPSFTIIERAHMPHIASSRSRMLTVLIFAFLGGLVDGVVVLLLSLKKNH